MGSKHPRSTTSAPAREEERQAHVDTEHHTEPPFFNTAAPEAAEMQVTVTPTTPPTSMEQEAMMLSGEEPSKLAVPQQQHLPRKFFTMAEVQQLISVNPGRTLVIIRDKVYDVTTFLASHPGGKSALRRNNGKDVTDAFFSMHSATAMRKLPDFLIGELAPSESTPAAAEETPTAALVPVRLRMADITKALSEDPNRIILIFFSDAYDVTPMRDKHPGGLSVLANNNGRECGDTFMRIHGLLAKKMVKQFYLGPVEGPARRRSPLRPAVAAEAESAAIPPAGPKTQSTRILEMERVNSTATIRYFTFSCPKPLHMIPGGHIKLYSNLHKEESRFYTPFKTGATSFTICMKHYPNGRTSGYFFDLKEGDEVFFDGPLPPSWHLNTDAAVQRAAPEERHVVLIAGGTGIVPLYSISSDALETQLSSVTFVCSVRTPDDLILATELRRLASRYSTALPIQKHTLRIVLLFSRASPQDISVEATSFASHVLCGGRLTAESFKGTEIRPAQAVVVCGPPTFNDAVAAAVLEAGICTATQVHRL
ncbi:putative nitrate reductase [Leishmania infantum JPCM5]|uniref:Acyl-lipid (7-3)-desaturase n=2 Tax=Leishmania infantum TaxID=5671 RepID=A0A6L0XJK2_LEIIN|nr:putative nitrate reductase [Leishmania infantum JPCM5]CAC9512192.1 nitrate_reductase_-_putative [Leishmania infantum]CAM69957.1 putative nitrate reductase [Leishmania infantum JPCM5]SUZ43876.1 nitrate_reductase_-_putative [Leishmania infantum]|eukprot:XP_001466908.1 putative nitrate reductase [Leishmania infantum JPCM5]